MFAAEAFSLPPLPPYLEIVETRKQAKTGVNFAVSGATAVDTQFFYAHGLGQLVWTNDSLSVQLGWFKKHKSSMCSTKQGRS